MWIGVLLACGWIYLMGTIGQPFFAVVGGGIVLLFILGLQSHAEDEMRQSAIEWQRRWAEERADMPRIH